MSATNDIKYFEYCRKSSEGEDRQVQSIERQREENMRLIERNGLKVVGSFEESRSARKPNNRPAFTEMVRRLKKGEANGVVCWHINRLSRNPFESGIIQQMLSDGMIMSIQTKDKEYLPSDNLIVISVETGMSSQYSKDLGNSVKSGIDKKIAKGMAPISAPLGYINTKHEERGANYIIKDPERFSLVRKAWDMMLSGAYTPPKILEIMTNDYGLRTRKTKRKGGTPLARSSIYRMFTDPFYAGLFVYKGVTHQGAHDPMVTLEEFDKVQILLGRAGRPRPKKHSFAYTGLMTCGECGSAITACEKNKVLRTTGEVRTYILYHCTRRKKGAKNCTQRTYIPVDELEKWMIDELRTHAISPDFLKFALEVLQEESGASAEKEQAIIESQLREVSKLESEVKTLFKMRLNEALSDEEYKSERADRENAILRLKQNIQRSEAGVNGPLGRGEEKLRSITAMDERFRLATPSEKKSIFMSLGRNHTIKDKKLLLHKHEWLQPIVQNKQLIESCISRLELEKRYYPQRKKEVFDLLRPIVRALVDEVGDDELVIASDSVPGDTES